MERKGVRMDTTRPASRPEIKYLSAAILVLVIPLLIWVTSLILENNAWINGHDWLDYFRPASLAMLRGQTPYTYPVYNPPWVLALLAPLALLPDNLSVASIVLLSYLSYALVIARLKVDKWNFLIFLANPALFEEIMQSNIDWIVPLGLAFPPQIGLFFVLAKPQIGAGVALFWLVEAYRSGGTRQVIKTFLPVTIAFALSFALYGFYFLNGTEVLAADWNKSFFPYAVPLGLFLMYYSLKKRDVFPALASAIFLSPYFAPQSLSVPIFGTVKSRWLLVGAVVVSWVVWLIWM